MELANLIDARRVMLDVEGDCSKAVFRCVAEKLEPLTGMPARLISNALGQRERMGSTGVGGGIAIPHARLEGLKAAQAFFIRLKSPIDMDSVDDAPVDILFVLLVPAEADNDHLRVLSRVSRLLRDEANLMQLRSLSDPEAVAALFKHS